MSLYSVVIYIYTMVRHVEMKCNMKPKLAWLRTLKGSTVCVYLYYQFIRGNYKHGVVNSAVISNPV